MDCSLICPSIVQFATKPLIEFYRGRGLLEVIDATASPDEVLRATVDAIERRRES